MIRILRLSAYPLIRPDLDPSIGTNIMRHTALQLRGETLHVYYSNAGDCPERILRSSIELGHDWMQWQASPPEEVIRPEMEYEGAGLACVASRRGWAPEPVHQLRDPGIFEEAGRTYLLYAVAGEAGIAAAEVLD